MTESKKPNYVKCGLCGGSGNDPTHQDYTAAGNLCAACRGEGRLLRDSVAYKIYIEGQGQ